MALPDPKSDRKYSYADYLTWDDDQRWELIDGVLYNMSPAPLIRHQEIQREIGLSLGNFLTGKPCTLFFAPVDVRFKDIIHAVDDETFTVVQPDLLVVCDKSKIDAKGINGAPDICIEILSESTAYKDQSDKFMLYQKHGVREYWIVNPGLETVEVFVNKGGNFEKPIYLRKEDTLTSNVLGAFELPLSQIFTVHEESV